MWLNAEEAFKQALQVNRDAYLSMLELSEIFISKSADRCSYTICMNSLCAAVGRKELKVRVRFGLVSELRGQIVTQWVRKYWSTS